MTKQTIFVLVAASVLAACGDDHHATPASCNDLSCDDQSHQGATGTDGGAAAANSDGGKITGSTGSSSDSGSSGNSGSSQASDSDAATSSSSNDAGSGGAAASDAGTTTADAGSSAPSGDTKPSAGCGKAAPKSGDLMIDVSGTSREYILALPKNYDVNTPHKLVFAFHGQGGTAQQIAQTKYYGLSSQSGDSVIYVAGQGLTTTNQVGTGAGWANSNGEDVAFIKALYAQLQASLCIDESRVFSVGMSYGGIMSDTLGCQMGDVFRAIAPMSGEGPGYGKIAPKCVGQVAVWMSNGNMDTVVPTAQEEASRDYWVKANHCQTTSKAVDPSPCLAYDGCDSGFPVTWCEFAGGHTIPSFAATAIWKFFSQF